MERSPSASKQAMKDRLLDRTTLDTCLLVLERLQEDRVLVSTESEAVQSLQQYLKRLDVSMDLEAAEGIEDNLDESSKSYLESFREKPRHKRHSLLGRTELVGESPPMSLHNLRHTGGSQMLVNLMSQFESLDSFNIFKVATATDGRPLETVALALLDRYSLCDKLGLPVCRVKAFLRAVELGYKSNPYHNGMHAADVVQALAWLLSGDSFTRQLTDLELLCIIVAAAVHDVGHPGVRNDFLVNVGTEAALRYNDNSVNENGHAALAFELLYKQQHNFIEHLNEDERRFFRRTVVNVILATDMSLHDDHLQEFKGKLHEHGADINQWPSEGREVLLRYLLHAADISNPLRPWPLSGAWSRRIMEEFASQGDRERAMGMPVSPLCDRETTDWRKSQLVFLDCVVKPVYDALLPLAPNAAATALRCIESSRSDWQTAPLLDGHPLGDSEPAHRSPSFPDGVPKVPSNSVFPLDDVQ